jgi:hypothetical protein
MATPTPTRACGGAVALTEKLDSFDDIRGPVAVTRDTKITMGTK